MQTIQMMKAGATMFGVLAVAALTAGTASAAEMTGYVSDAACATKSAKAAHAMDWIKPEAFEGCVKTCAKDGSALVFVTEDNKILKFDQASLAKVTPHAGHRVKVTADVAGDTVKIASIAPIAMVRK